MIVIMDYYNVIAAIYDTAANAVEFQGSIDYYWGV